uniref:Uncharacterized protein n=1 Tax=Arundo donax TaxID=35708 RepID=A0A0A8ZP59_ARUDO
MVRATNPYFLLLMFQKTRQILHACPKYRIKLSCTTIHLKNISSE